LPRKRRKNKTPETPVKDRPVPKQLQPKIEINLEELTIDQVSQFTVSREPQVVIIYEVSTKSASNEDVIRNYKLQLETALVKAANNNKHRITRDKFNYKALPVGNSVLLKAFYLISDVSGGSGQEQHTKTRPPIGREGLIIEE